MSISRAKPGLGLMVLVAWIGSATGAGAGFAFSETAPVSSRWHAPFPAAWPLALTGEEALKPAAPHSLGSWGVSAPWHQKNDNSNDPRLPSKPWPAPSGSPANGASLPGSSPPGTSSKVTAPFTLSAAPSVFAAGAAECLFLAEERFKAPPFRGRLFRPPRVCCFRRALKSGRTQQGPDCSREGLPSAAPQSQ